MDNEIMGIFPNAEYDSNIYIYIYNSAVKTKFSDEAQEHLFAIESNSWWFKHRANVIHNIFKKYMDNKLTIDIGGGNGFTTKYLQDNGVETCLLEPTYAACVNAKKRGLNNVVCGILSEKDVRDVSIPQAMMLDVLEHIEHDTEFLLLLNKKLSKAGKVLITVPALKSLWSSEDDSAGHFRRYDHKLLRKTAEECGFKVIYINYFFEFAFLPILLIRVFLEKLHILKRTDMRSKEEEEKIANDQFKERKGIVGAVLKFFEKQELKRLNKGTKIRFGSSLICVIEKISDL